MGRKSFVIALHFLCLAGTGAVAQPGPFVTVLNSNLLFAASTLTTNGIPGLTNAVPRLLVSAVAAMSSHGGSVALVNTQAWVRRYDGTGNSSDTAVQVVVDGCGNVLVAGFSLGQTTGYDFATVKYAADGTPLWTNRYDGPLHKYDFVRYLAVDGAGNVYVNGDSEDLGSRKDVVTVKYSSSGTPVWTNRFNTFGTNYVQAGGLAVDSAGNSYILPQDYDDPSPAFTIVKYDTLGAVVWTNRYKGAPDGTDYAAAIVVDGAGSVFVTGLSDGIGTFNNWDTVKYAANGTCLWTNHYTKDFGAQPSAMRLDRTGNVILTGDVFGAQHQYATLKYANNGTPLWTNLLAGPSYQGGNVPTVATDMGGNVFVTGGSPAANDSDADFTTIKLTGNGIPVWTNRFFETNLGNPYPAGTIVDNAGNFYFAGHSRDSNGVNYVTVKYSGDGLSLRTNHYNGPSDTDDYANGIAAGDNGNIYVTGLSSGWQAGLDFATLAYADYVLYTPPLNFIGTDTFAFAVVDHDGNVATGLVSVVVMPPSLQFNTTSPNLQFTTQGLRLKVEGASGTNPVILFASSNVVNWQPIYTNPPVLGSASFIDSAATNQPRRFYRARQ